jgi:hypothetical protein
MRGCFRLIGRDKRLADAAADRQQPVIAQYQDAAVAEIGENAFRPPDPRSLATGEIAGGLLYHKYASGTGLISGAVFVRLAGRNAAKHAKG